MIIGSNFIIGHIPKTGGHALAVMMQKTGIAVKHPFHIKDNRRAISTDQYKHKTFDQLTEEELYGKKLYLILRQLPDWYLSILIQQGKHTRINAKGRITKRFVGQTYWKEAKQADFFLLMPEFNCHTVYPDYMLQKHLCNRTDITFLRMEYLTKDISKKMGINLKGLPKRVHSYEHPDVYWNEKSIKILRKNNPIWTNLEAQLYKDVPDSD